MQIYMKQLFEKHIYIIVCKLENYIIKNKSTTLLPCDMDAIDP